MMPRALRAATSAAASSSGTVEPEPHPERLGGTAHSRFETARCELRRKLLRLRLGVEGGKLNRMASSRDGRTHRSRR